MDVCLLNDSFPPVIDGVANVVVNYARIIARDYGSAVVATPRYPDGIEDYPFPVVLYPSVKTPKTSGYRLGIPIPGIVKEIKRYSVNIIHCHCPFVSAVIAKQLRQSTGAPVIMTYHTKFDIDIANNTGSPILQAAARKFIVSNIKACDEVWAVSKGSGENLKSLGYNGDYLVMDNGVDFPKGRADESLIDELSSSLELQPDIPVFLFVGRMMWYKGVRLILDGLREAKEAGVSFRMVFVGGGGDFDDVTRYAVSLGLHDDCIFTGPVRDREKLRAYYSRADFFLFPSTFDSAPITIREAAACGLAGVLVRGSTAAEPVTDGVNAILIDEDSSALARVVIDLAGNRDKMKALGERARDDLYLSWDTAVGRALERYQVVLERHAAKRSAPKD